VTNVNIVTFKKSQGLSRILCGSRRSISCPQCTQPHAAQSFMLHRAPCCSLLYFMGLGSQKMKNIVKETTYEDFMIKLNDILEEFLKFYRKFTLNYCPSKNLI
jgi:hypothetical protein